MHQLLKIKFKRLWFGRYNNITAIAKSITRHSFRRSTSDFVALTECLAGVSTASCQLIIVIRLGHAGWFGPSTSVCSAFKLARLVGVADRGHEMIINKDVASELTTIHVNTMKQ